MFFLYNTNTQDELKNPCKYNSICYIAALKVASLEIKHNNKIWICLCILMFLLCNMTNRCYIFLSPF